MDLADVTMWIHEAEYEKRGSPADSFETALQINDLWLCDEVADAFERRDLQTVRNLGAAAFVKTATAESSLQLITASQAFHLATSKAVELDNIHVNRV